MAKQTAPRALGWIAFIAGIVALGALLAWFATRLPIGNIGDRSAGIAHIDDPALIKRGEYLAKAGDCVACHTAPGGEPFAGGLPMVAPIGTIYSSNITPDPKTGIGRYGYGDFERAVRRGIRPNGDTLYPAMPYPSYARVTDADTQALYAYFMLGVKPVDKPYRPNGIRWPLSMRWPLTYWRWMFAPSAPAPLRATTDAVFDRGAYLVEGLGHCGACHTPRAITMQEKALTGDSALFLGGGVADNWIAPNLRNGSSDGVGLFQVDELVRLLKGGSNERTSIFGGMTDVVQHSTQYMSDTDLQAIATYLKSLGGANASAPFTEDPAAARNLRAGITPDRGSRLYVDNCATCHRTTGKGYASVFPSLAGNPVVLGNDPRSLVHIVLAGSISPSTSQAPAQFTMPPFADRLSDQDIADILSFVRTRWGNQQTTVDAGQVARLRKMLAPPQAAKSVYDPRTNDANTRN
jgi:mono/diheme cytochrome c family protein